jgi:hypothetical protein
VNSNSNSTTNLKGERIMPRKNPPYTLADFLPPPPEDNPDWRWLSPAEESFLLAATRDWQTQQELVAKAGLKPNRDHGYLLDNLVARNILVKNPDLGFRLHPLTTTPAFPRVERGARRMKRAS